MQAQLWKAKVMFERKKLIKGRTHLVSYEYFSFEKINLLETTKCDLLYFAKFNNLNTLDMFIIRKYLQNISTIKMKYESYFG